MKKLLKILCLLVFFISCEQEVVDAVQQAMETAGPVIVDFIVNEDEGRFPFIPNGQSVKEMLEEPTFEEIA